jgi:voltage-gated potassium channel
MNTFMSQYLDFIYMMFITITTVGYGDFTPRTDAGRIFIMMGAIWGAFIISLIVLVVGNTFALNKN